MDTKLIYAIFASLFLHGLIIILWPRMWQPQIKEFGHITGVTLIEYLSSFDLNTGADSIKSNHNPVKMEKVSNEIHKIGKMITNRVLENHGHRSWENMSDHDISITRIRLSKQSIIPGKEEYAMVWPEELADAIQMDIQTFYPSQGGIRHKDMITILSNTDISGSLLSDEFPEERPAKQIPDITWKGNPRTWITRPEQSPTYKGDEEGLVKLRFWVNKNGEVVNAIPIQKLSVELEEKALAYIFAWRFEPSLNIPLQEGIIRINFKLDQNER